MISTPRDIVLRMNGDMRRAMAEAVNQYTTGFQGLPNVDALLATDTTN